MRRLLALIPAWIGLATALPGAGTYLVVPFENASQRPDLDWIGESIAETIREALGSYDLPVVSREDWEYAAHNLQIRPAGRLTKASLMTLGVESGAEFVVHGRFEISGDASQPPPEKALSIRGASIDIERTMAGPEWEASGRMADLSRLQSLLAWRILRSVAPDKSPAEEEYLENLPPIRIDAIENYIRGLLAPDLDQKHRLFTLAVNLEPEFSQPSFQLGRMHWEDGNYRAAAQWLERVQPTNSHYLEANFLLGLCRYSSGDYAGSLAAFEMVAASVPVPSVYNNLALAQFKEGIPQAAIESLEWALDREPGDADYHFNIGYLLWRQGDLDSAKERFAAALKLEPSDIDAAKLLERCEHGRGPRRGDLSGQGLERLKMVFGPESRLADLNAAGQMAQ